MLSNHGDGYGTGYGTGYGYGDGYGYGYGYGYGKLITLGILHGRKVEVNQDFGVLKVGGQCHSFSWWEENWQDIADKYNMPVRTYKEIYQLIRGD